MPDQYFYAGGSDPYSAIAGQQYQRDQQEENRNRYLVAQMAQAEAQQREMAARQAQLDQARINQQAAYDFQAAAADQARADRAAERALSLGLNRAELARQAEQEKYRRGQDDLSRAFQERQFQSGQSKESRVEHDRQYQTAYQLANQGVFDSPNDVMQRFDLLTPAEHDELSDISERKTKELERNWRFAAAAADTSNRVLDYKKAKEEALKHEGYPRERFFPESSSSKLERERAFAARYPEWAGFVPSKIGESDLQNAQEQEWIKRMSADNKLDTLIFNEGGRSVPTMPMPRTITRLDSDTMKRFAEAAGVYNHPVGSPERERAKNVARKMAAAQGYYWEN